MNNNRRSFLKTGAALGTGLIASTAAFTSSASALRTGSQRNLVTDTKKRILGSGRHRIEVSPLGLGCMGMSYHRSFIPEKKYMISLLRNAVDSGVTFFDTAEAYGPYTNEVLVGEALAPVRKRIILCTKFGFNIRNNQLSGLNSQPAQIRKVVENSLRSLRTDYIDLLYQHRVDPAVPVEDVAGAVQQLIREGKVKHFGMSEASSASIRKAHAVQPVTALQREYSLMTRQPENDVIKTCEELGIGFVPYSPLSRGFLSGYLNERTKYIASNDNRATLPRYQPEAVKANWGMIETLAEFANQRGLTAAQVALAWLLAQKPWIVPIPSTTKQAHLHENMTAANYQFEGNELEQLTIALNKIKIVGDRYTGAQAEQTNK